MTDRMSLLREYQFQWPAFDRTLLPGLMRGLMLLLILVGALWGLAGLFGRRSDERQGSDGRQRSDGRRETGDGSTEVGTVQPDPSLRSGQAL
jgi:hypothetical protein